MYIIDSDHNDHVMSVGQEIWTPFNLVLTYALLEKKVEDYSVDLTEEISSFDY
jgi:hypothetical protein